MSTNRPRLTILALSLGAAALLACATTPPSQLVSARNAYRSAAAGPASASAPEQLAIAEKALARAERSYNAKDDTGKIVDLAYIAQRRSELATVVANRRLAEQRATAFKDQRAALSEELRKDAARDLGTAKDELADASQRTKEATEAKIQAERDADAAREEARETTARMEEAREQLAKWAQLVETQRGLVITLSSGVLFETAEANVLPAAGSRLAAVAQFLQQSPERNVRVEGHTDNAGGTGYNQGLSQSRADAVRAFLVTHGVPPHRVVSVGYGESQPIATNSTIEGRANNRRVEIVLEPLPAPIPPPSNTTPPPIPSAEPRK